jgi:hypothetical protein
MKILLDETGSFRDNSKDLEYGMVTAVIISDRDWEKLNKYLNGVFLNGWSDVKGTNITFEKRREVLKFIGRNNSIKYLTLINNLKLSNDTSVELFRKGQNKKIDQAIERVHKVNGSQELIEDLRILKSRFAKLSIGEYVKLMSFYEVYKKLIPFLEVDLYEIPTSSDGWEIEHIIDSQNQPGKFLTVLRNHMALTLNHLHDDYFVIALEEMSGHPFRQKYSGKVDGIEGFDNKKFFKKIEISSEENRPELIIPDLIGNTIHKSIKNQNERKWLKALKLIKRNRSNALRNKRTGEFEDYYHITGFDPTVDMNDLNKFFTSHWIKMKNL